MKNHGLFILSYSDFGLAQLLDNTETLTSLRGSPLYMAPEILLKQSYDASVDLVLTCCRLNGLNLVHHFHIPRSYSGLQALSSTNACLVKRLIPVQLWVT